jgi:hypothetical protein
MSGIANPVTTWGTQTWSAGRRWPPAVARPGRVGLWATVSAPAMLCRYKGPIRMSSAVVGVVAGFVFGCVCAIGS